MFVYMVMVAMVMGRCHGSCLVGLATLVGATL